MKQPLLSLMKTQKLFSLTKSMTENSKNACWLLLSVILLTGTVTGIAGPLENCVRQMAEQTSFRQKELVLYREFAKSKPVRKGRRNSRMFCKRCRNRCRST